MSDLIEMLRDVLTVQKLATEVELPGETKTKINHVCQEYIERLLIL